MKTRFDWTWNNKPPIETFSEIELREMYDSFEAVLQRARPSIEAIAGIEQAIVRGQLNGTARELLLSTKIGLFVGVGVEVGVGVHGNDADRRLHLRAGSELIATDAHPSALVICATVGGRTIRQIADGQVCSSFDYADTGYFFLGLGGGSSSTAKGIIPSVSEVGVGVGALGYGSTSFVRGFQVPIPFVQLPTKALTQLKRARALKLQFTWHLLDLDLEAARRDAVELEAISSRVSFLLEGDWRIAPTSESISDTEPLHSFARLLEPNTVAGFRRPFWTLLARICGQRVGLYAKHSRVSYGKEDSFPYLSDDSIQ